MKTLDRKILRRFLKLAGERLRGDWVLIGGTVLAALDADFRSTMDIDFVGLDNPAQSETLRLMEIADELRLPVESINQAGAYFLHKIPDFRKHLIEIGHCSKSGDGARIFRPDSILYFQLKLPRLSESDSDDCIAFLAFTSEQELPLISKQISRELKKCGSTHVAHAANTANIERRARLKNLLRVVHDRQERTRPS